MQPLITPLYASRSAHELLEMLIGQLFLVTAVAKAVNAWQPQPREDAHGVPDDIASVLITRSEQNGEGPAAADA